MSKECNDRIELENVNIYARLKQNGCSVSFVLNAQQQTIEWLEKNDKFVAFNTTMTRNANIEQTNGLKKGQHFN